MSFRNIFQRLVKDTVIGWHANLPYINFKTTKMFCLSVYFREHDSLQARKHIAVPWKHNYKVVPLKYCFLSTCEWNRVYSTVKQLYCNIIAKYVNDCP